MHGSHAKVSEALQATILDAPPTFRWLGERPHYPLPQRILRNSTPAQVRGFLLESLRLTLYRDFYCQGFASPRKQNRVLPMVPHDGSFVGELSAANRGQGAWEAGWTLRSVEADRSIIVEKQLAVGIPEQDVHHLVRGEQTPGARVLLRTTKESIRGAPGYYVAFGNVPFPDNETQELVRFYFNLKANGASRLIELISIQLNLIEIPFQLKVLENPGLYHRCDAGVLYVSKTQFDIVADVISRNYHQCVEYLKPGTPIFTKTLAQGLGLAEDPPDHQSFGRNRCGLLAEAIVRAKEKKILSIEDRIDVVDQVFRESGISLQTPYLNSGSIDVYKFEIANTSPRLRLPDQLEPGARMSTVSMIAAKLCAGAVWSKDRCNWLGSELQEDAADRVGLRLTARALGPELYAGSSGVGLFLAEAYRVTRDPVLRRTACGAIRHALSRIESVPPSKRIGLFTGLIGIALAAARVGQCCEDEYFVEQARQLALNAMQPLADERECDLLSGRAGAIVGLLALSALLELHPLSDFTRDLGDELLKSAHISERGASWPALGALGGPHLTGFSHGTAGVGYALLELSHWIGGARHYQALAEEAFKYERSWFDPGAANWPHFNVDGRGRGKFGPAPTFDSHWCHGAPGIVLSRLRAYRLFGNLQHRSEALAGLETTKRALHMWLASDSGNFSLCHGFAGNAEVLRYASDVLTEDCRTGFCRELCEEIANYGIKTYSRGDAQWPCGIGPEEHPGLMIGLAGIGHFYLRLCDPGTPSILMLEPEKFIYPGRVTSSRSQ